MLLIDGFEGLGTRWWVEVLERPDSFSLDDIKQAVEKEITRFDHVYSRFLPGSVVSVLNKRRLLNYPSSEFIQLLQIGLDLFNKTDGLFNPALAEILENRGYDPKYSFEHKNQPEYIPEFDKLVQIQPEQIILNGRGKLDFGGFGKGYLIDSLSLILGQMDVNHYLINGGGDLLVSFSDPQKVILENPFQEGYSIGPIELQNSSLACSSNLKRAWRDGLSGQVFTHLINPKTSQNLPPVGSFVVADSAMVADVMATLTCLLVEDLSELKKLQSVFRFEWAVLHQNMELTRSSGFPEVLP
jgi:FAD:protein FMN transferase